MRKFFSISLAVLVCTMLAGNAFATQGNNGNGNGGCGVGQQTNGCGTQGPKGDTGAQGPKGDTGAQGPKGDTGDKGDAGTNGKDGESIVGATGAEGKPGNGTTYVGTIDGVTQDQFGKTTADMQRQINDNGRRAKAGVATAIGIASLVQATEPNSTIVTIGVGAYGGEGAAAVGASHQNASGTTYKLGIGVDTKRGVGVGLSAGWKF